MDRPVPFEIDRSERAAFIRRTYAHLAGAILAFVALETVAFTLLKPMLDGYMMAMVHNPIMQLVVMIAFIGSSYLARYWAFNGGSPAMQYAGLGLYVVAEAVIFVPLLYIAMGYAHGPVGDMTLIQQAGILTMCLFAGLTCVVFTTGKDFSFLRPILIIGGFIALGIVLCAVFFPMAINLGLWFSVAMIVLAAGSILYDTSNVMLHYRMDQHVAASLSLFASVALLFYYVLLALMQSRR
jgi:hypothetical protein